MKSALTTARDSSLSAVARIKPMCECAARSAQRAGQFLLPGAFRRPQTIERAATHRIVQPGRNHPPRLRPSPPPGGHATSLADLAIEPAAPVTLARGIPRTAESRSVGCEQRAHLRRAKGGMRHGNSALATCSVPPAVVSSARAIAETASSRLTRSDNPCPDSQHSTSAARAGPMPFSCSSSNRI